MSTSLGTFVGERKNHANASSRPGACRLMAVCTLYHSLHQYPGMGVWKKLYCYGSFTACRHFSMMDDGLFSP